MLLFINFKSNCWITKNFSSCSIVQWNKLARHEVIFNLKKSYIFSATTNEAIIYVTIKFEAYKIKVT